MASATCNAYTNTAQIEETSQQAQQTVNVCVPNVTLSKTVSVARGGDRGRRNRHARAAG